MKRYVVNEYPETGKYLVSVKGFDSQKKLRDYLSEHGASYDAHKLSELGDDMLVIKKINLGGNYIEIEESVIPPKTDSVYIDGIEYISLDGAMEKYDMSLSQVKYAQKTRMLKSFSAGFMGRVFVEDVFGD